MPHPIVTAARSWLGTRFHHQGRLKKSSLHPGGVDCLGLLVGVARELDLRDRNGIPLSLYDETHYSHTPDCLYLERRLTELLAAANPGDIRPGDIVLLAIQNQPQHLAIISDRKEGLSLIHAYAPARAVVEHPLDPWWMQSITAAFRI